MTPIYLDYNATTPIDPAVREAMLPYFSAEYGNPSSTHVLGRSSQSAIAAAREQIASLLGCDSGEILFTSGGTESSNLAIQGALFHAAPERNGHLIISAIEHPATIEPARWLERQGFGVTVVGCDVNGTINPDEIAAAIRPTTALVSVMHANNEVGSIQPIREISEICRTANVKLHVDAAQSTGKINADVNELGVDLLTLAGHKVYAPKGIGALYVRDGVMLEPVVRGAGHERGLRPGTENTPYIVGLGVAADLAKHSLPAITEQLAAKRDRLESGLRGRIPNLTVNAASTARLPNTASVNFPAVVGAELLDAVPEICASTGAACHSGTTKLSATLAAMGVAEEVARGTVRLSVGRSTTAEEIDTAIERLAAAWQQRSV
jgi:cysteine desulfurase